MGLACRVGWVGGGYWVLSPSCLLDVVPRQALEVASRTGEKFDHEPSIRSRNCDGHVNTKSFARKVRRLRRSMFLQSLHDNWRNWWANGTWALICKHKLRWESGTGRFIQQVMKACLTCWFTFNHHLEICTFPPEIRRCTVQFINHLWGGCLLALQLWRESVLIFCEWFSKRFASTFYYSLAHS